MLTSNTNRKEKSRESDMWLGVETSLELGMDGYNRCFVYACPFCIGHLDMKHPWYNLSFQEKHLNMVHILKSEGYSVREIWEQEYDRKHNLYPEFKGLIQDLDVQKHKKLELRVKLNISQSQTNSCHILYKLCRLFLYNFLQILGDRVHYTDTDSIIYIHRPPSPEIPLDYLLGLFKSELSDPEDYIVTLVCCGLKSYGYLTKKNVTFCHLKGFTLDYNTCRQINLATMTDMVTQDQDKRIVTHYSGIRHDRSDMTKKQNDS